MKGGRHVDPTPTRVSLTSRRPDLRHLKDQAKDLLKAGGAASLADAQFQLAREYGFASWPKLKAHVESLQEVGQLKAAIDANDLERVQAMMTRNPALHRAPLGYNKNGPLTWVAECRGVPCSPERLAIARWMIEHGSDVHQGGDGPLMRAALSDERIPMMELLVEHGADVNAQWDGRYPIICAPCETLQPGVLKWLIAHGADIRRRQRRLRQLRADAGLHVLAQSVGQARLPGGFCRGRLHVSRHGSHGHPSRTNRSARGVPRARARAARAAICGDGDLSGRAWR